MTPDAPEKFRRVWLVGFAGHRQVTDPEALKAVIRRELEGFVASLDGEVIGLASAAAGADLLFLEACGEAGLRTVVILPFNPARFEQDFEDPAEWRRACGLMEAALWCEEAAGNEEAPAAYHVVAREMLEFCDRMLFVWNGKQARGLGGTAETVKEAGEREIPSRIIDALSLEARWQTGSPPKEPEDATFANLPAARSVEELFDRLDKRAVTGAPQSRWFAAGSMSVNDLAVVLPALCLALALAEEAVAAVIGFTMAVVATALPGIGDRLRLQEKWVADRVRAELLRSVLASHEPGSPLRPPVSDLFETERAFVRSAALQLVRKRLGWEAARDTYMEQRLDGQIGFFKSKGELAKKRLRLFGGLFWAASTGSMIFTGFDVFMQANGAEAAPELDRWALEFLPTALPGLAGWSLAMISVFEFRRRANLYTQMAGTLQRLRPKLAEAKCASASEAAIRQIERLLLNELWEWQGSRRG